MKNYRTKAPMPLFYLQIENGVDAPKIYDFTELLAPSVPASKLNPSIAGTKVNQCWRCQGVVSLLRGVSPAVKCAGPHAAKIAHSSSRRAHEVRELLGRSCGQRESVP
ncbi:zinc finger protein [Trichonephila clavipes]|uniref:Zinc finger protein n=1 Tax=Trichonephila clavipes TaxID=2585209 RepID=A0A8X6UX14_TRICX|nr:zinc finger protein [Trichonephila clavipes]